MVKKLVKKTEFAKMAGVSEAAISKACRAGGPLAKTLEGKRVNANHPQAAAYLEAKKSGTKPTKPKPTKPKPAPKPEAEDPLFAKVRELHQGGAKLTNTLIQREYKIGYTRAKKLLDLVKGEAPPPLENTPPPPPALDDGDLMEVPEDIQDFLDMTLHELTTRFGTVTRFNDWLKATKQIEDINEKRLKNAATMGELVNRQLVKIGIIDPIESAHVKLLTDGAKTIAVRAIAMHDSGRPKIDIEEFIRDQISSFIRPVKVKVERTLKDAGKN